MGKKYIPSLGTIGGGNHFCELQVVHEISDETIAQTLDLKKGDLTLLIHTGSRGLGAAIHAHYHRDANQGLLLEEEGQAYLKDHDQALNFAKANRQLVATRALHVLKTKGKQLLDISHNFAEAKDDCVLHRKGATPSDQGLVPIAGSRGDFTYLVQPNRFLPEALYSLAHGAGRKYERSSMAGRVRKNPGSLDALTRNPFGGRVICADKQLLMEEAPLAYKDIQKVVADMESFQMAKPVLVLRPVITFKTAQTKGDKYK